MSAESNATDESADEYEFESVSVMRLQKVDVLLFRSPERMLEARRTRQMAILEKLFPSHEILMLEGGEDLTVIRPAVEA